MPIRFEGVDDSLDKDAPAASSKKKPPRHVNFSNAFDDDGTNDNEKEASYPQVRNTQANLENATSFTETLYDKNVSLRDEKDRLQNMLKTMTRSKRWLNRTRTRIEEEMNRTKGTREDVLQSEAKAAELGKELEKLTLITESLQADFDEQSRTLSELQMVAARKSRHDVELAKLADDSGDLTETLEEYMQEIEVWKEKMLDAKEELEYEKEDFERAEMDFKSRRTTVAPGARKTRATRATRITRVGSGKLASRQTQMGAKMRATQVEQKCRHTQVRENQLKLMEQLDDEEELFEEIEERLEEVRAEKEEFIVLIEEGKKKSAKLEAILTEIKDEFELGVNELSSLHDHKCTELAHLKWQDKKLEKELNKAVEEQAQASGGKITASFAKEKSLRRHKTEYLCEQLNRELTDGSDSEIKLMEAELERETLIAKLERVEQHKNRQQETLRQVEERKTQIEELSARHALAKSEPREQEPSSSEIDPSFAPEVVTAQAEVEALRSRQPSKALLQKLRDAVDVQRRNNAAVTTKMIKVKAEVKQQPERQEQAMKALQSTNARWQSRRSTLMRRVARAEEALQKERQLVEETLGASPSKPSASDGVKEALMLLDSSASKRNNSGLLARERLLEAHTVELSSNESHLETLREEQLSLKKAIQEKEVLRSHGRQAFTKDIEIKQREIRESQELLISAQSVLDKNRALKVLAEVQEDMEVAQQEALVLELEAQIKQLTEEKRQLVCKGASEIQEASEVKAMSLTSKRADPWASAASSTEARVQASVASSTMPRTTKNATVKVQAEPCSEARIMTLSSTMPQSSKRTAVQVQAGECIEAQVQRVPGSKGGVAPSQSTTPLDAEQFAKLLEEKEKSRLELIRVLDESRIRRQLSDGKCWIRQALSRLRR